ncbi:UNVERIFIED_CONTAM: hypothetical protein GTU68_021153 [Idotea baltica]|nr:hypothetical protein [Idotea baltica]
MTQKKTSLPASAALNEFANTIAKLRNPESGCPWDLEQDHRSLRPYAIEEAYELVEAIEEGSDEELKQELGDVLLQVALHSQIASERGAFTLSDVIQSINEKMIFRHPHVFGESKASNSEEVLEQWNALKKKEKGTSAEEPLSDTMRRTAKSLPALERASKIGKLAAGVGFDWECPKQVIAKVEEELLELKAAIAANSAESNKLHIAEELGDLLFAISQLSRHLKLSPEVALSDGISKFIKRFKHLEPSLTRPGTAPSIKELEDAWQKAKGLEQKAD